MMHEDPQMSVARTTLNDLELTSVRALVSYAAYHQKTSENLVEQIVSAEFSVADIAELKRTSFDDAIRFLVDLQVEILLN